jgi:hypothetical protein
VSKYFPESHLIHVCAAEHFSQAVGHATERKCNNENMFQQMMALFTFLRFVIIHLGNSEYNMILIVKVLWCTSEENWHS